MQRYGAYKDSGIEWVGEIPERWETVSLKRIATYARGFGIQRSEVLEQGMPCVRYGELYTTYKEAIAEPESFVSNEVWDASLKLNAGDLVMSLTGETKEDIGPTSVNSSGRSLAVGGDAIVVRPINQDGRFLAYALNSDYVCAQKHLASTGEIIIHLGAEKVGNLSVVKPGINEQKAIADYLDAKTVEIDSAIADCEREVELLREYRKAVVSEAVTKGLDPNAPMKDSGVEWIGEIPKEWKSFRMGSLYREASETGYPDLPILSVSIHSGISDRELADDELEKVVNRSENRSLYKRVLKNDLAYNMMRAWQGAIGASRVDGVVSPAYTVLRPTRPDIALTPYIEYLLRTASAIEELRRRSYGITDFRLRLYWQYFKDMTVYLPSLDKQAAIVSYLDAKTTEIDNLVEAKLAMADKLREYRKSLISEAVTGKFRVPGA